MKAILFVIAFGLAAQAQVRYLGDRKLFVLDAGAVSYVFGVNDLNRLQHVYWGKRLTRDADLRAPQASASAAFESGEGLTNEEYSGWGGMRYYEPDLKVTLADGTRDLVLQYVSHDVTAEQASVRLKDIRYDLFVTLTWRVYPKHGIVRKSAHIENRTSQAVTIESAQSGVWYVPPGPGYRLTRPGGRWGGETQVIREPVELGIKVLDSRRGNTSHQANPWFALDRDAGEEHGQVWFGALAFSGNWRISIEQTPTQQVRVTGGYNTFDFSYTLKPGESLETPDFYGGFSDAGFGGVSRTMHRFEREELLPDRAAPKVRPVLYNSWEATTFNVDETSQKALADKAAKIGVELFVIDDGWFGQRNHSRAGLGDWSVNPKKFPNGLKPLIDHVNSLGMKFGLWVEPEMVNPDSDLYRTHPDWVIHMKDRPRTEGRNQLILNMARDDVKEYIFNVFDRLLAENKIDFIKWDMNRHFTEPGWPEVAPAEQRKLWVKYPANVYEIFDRLRAKHPHVEVESCSGGGGRPWTSASSGEWTRCGRRTTPTPLTGCASRRASRSPTRLR